MAEQVVTNDGVVTTNYVPDPYAAVTQGQLKQFTARAVNYLNANLSGGAGTNLNTMVSNWAEDYATNGYATNTANPTMPYKPSDLTAMNVGQLKSIAGSVYGRLSAVGYTELAPSWLHQNTNTDNMVANLGQLKQVFDFDLSLAGASTLTATNGGTGTIDLNWTLPSTNNVTSWLIEDQGSSGAWDVITNLTNPDTTSYAVTGLTNGDSYNFQVIGSGTNSVSLPASASGTPTAVPTSGLALWLRADAGVTTDGSGNVSAWADQSPNGNNAVQSSSGDRPTPVSSEINGEPVVRFNGSTDYLTVPDNSSLDISNVTIIAVYQVPDASDGTWIVNKPYSTSSTWSSPFLAYGLGIGISSGIQGLQVTTSGTRTQILSSFVVPATTPMLLTGIYDGTTMSLYNQGVLNVTASKSGDIDLGGSSGKDLCIGMRSSYSPGEYNQADLAELLIYNRALTASEQMQAELYLADKYNLAYSIAAPTITPNGGSFSSSTSVSFSFVPSPALIRYTLDGTSPTSSSTLYSGNFTLTQSRPVTAAVFLDNVKISPDASAQFYVGDTDGIGISDAWQIEYFGSIGISPNALSPGGSGLTNLQCYFYGYNPTLYSTNGDGLSDLVNYQLGYAGTDTDINGYGLTNAQQLALGLDPFDAGINPVQPTLPAGTSGDTVPPTITLTSPQGATLLP
jgi:hypothetical protein